MEQVLAKANLPLRQSVHPSESPIEPVTQDNEGMSQAKAPPSTPGPVPALVCLQADPVANNRPQSNAFLERVPAEIRSQILSMLALEDLGAVVHASPVLHRHYLMDRKYLLYRSLEATLHTATVDACAAYLCQAPDFLAKRSKATVTSFLKSYRDRRSSEKYSILTEGLTEEGLAGIASFHSSTVMPLVRLYADWALDNLAHAGGYPRGGRSLSQAEETRLVRAFYRFQLYCNLFGSGRRYWVDEKLRRNFDCMCVAEITEDFQQQMDLEPWEVEEMACIYEWVREMFDRAFSSIHWHVHRDSSKFAGERDANPEGAFDFDDPGEFTPLLPMQRATRERPLLSASWTQFS